MDPQWIRSFTARTMEGMSADRFQIASHPPKIDAKAEITSYKPTSGQRRRSPPENVKT